VTQEPAQQEPTVQEPAQQEPAMQEPAQQPTVQEPAQQEPTMREPVAQEPARQRPVALRASDQDRDEATVRLQVAFAEGRLDDAEFDRRMRAALTAVTRPELDTLRADLPAAATPPATGLPKSGQRAIAYKSSIRRGGRWRVPGRFVPVVYKGSGWIDLRAAELTEPVTTIVAIAYKSRVDILVPPGVRVEMDGFGVSKGWSAGEALESLLPANAPVVHVRGIAYKGTIETRTTPPEPEREIGR
jgi:hypothetical protein